MVEQETHKLLVVGSTPTLATLNNERCAMECAAMFLMLGNQEAIRKYEYLYPTCMAFPGDWLMSLSVVGSWPKKTQLVR